MTTSIGRDSTVASLIRVAHTNGWKIEPSVEGRKENRDGIEKKMGSTEPDMPAYCKQGRKNEEDPDVDCQLTFSILRNPTFPGREEPRVLLLFSMMRPASGTERRSGRQCDSMETLSHFASRLQAPGDFSRISINFHRIMLIELIFSSLPSPAYGRQDRQVMSGSMKLLSSLYSTTPFIL